jgi:hypothetical protein
MDKGPEKKAHSGDDKDGQRINGQLVRKQHVDSQSVFETSGRKGFARNL